jgi:hypothetical protein
MLMLIPRQEMQRSLTWYIAGNVALLLLIWSILQDAINIYDLGLWILLFL